MDKCSSRVQAPHLIGIYIALLTLGVFLDEDASHVSHQLHSSYYINQATIQKQIPKKSSVKDNILTYIHDLHSTGGFTASEKQGHMLVSKREPLSSSDSDDKLSPKSKYNYHENYQPLKKSTELNAFDEIVNLLTMSATHCTLLDLEGRVNSDSRKSVYHCAQNSFNRCTYGDSRNKQNIIVRCATNKHLVGYSILPSHLVQVDDQGKIFTVNDDSIEYHKAAGESPKYDIVVDAHYSFAEEFKTMHYAPVLRLDFTIDLTGLNSLHKYEVVVTLLKTIKEVMIRQQYFLERSSADRAQLQDYLHQEGLNQPLHILTLWKQYL